MGSRFDGKIAIVTGAASGIGRAVMQRLTSEGATVYALDRDGAKLKDSVAAVAGGRAVAKVCDVADVDTIPPLFAEIAKEAGGLHVLINNAGIGGAQARMHEYPIEEWDRVMSVNVRGAFAVLRAGLGIMVKQGGGSVVNTASIGSFRATPTSGAYITSKGAVLMMTRCAALEYAQDNIRINAICPGVIATDILSGSPPAFIDRLKSEVPQGRLGRPEEVAALVAFLASDEAPHITGGAYLIDGGRSAS